MLAAAGVGRLRAADADVGTSREHRRQRSLRRIAVVMAIPAAWLWWRIVVGEPIDLFNLRIGMPDPFLFMAMLLLLTMVVVLLGTTIGAGRSPHTTYRPEQISVSLDDVKGVDAVKEDVVRSLNLFLAHRAFTQEMGGTPRRGLLFEGLPGTGKTHLAKAMAREADVPFLFVSATAFQSMYYGATARKIRSYFRALRKAARREGGAIGFIEEIDAIATTRRGMAATPVDAVRVRARRAAGAAVPTTSPATVINPSAISEGTGGVVNELLVQMQSFDEPSGGQKARTWIVDHVNGLLPANRQLRRPTPPPTNVLLIAATNRAENLDPALLRPGRFDRRLTFDRPGRAARRELVDHFLARKAHVPELDSDATREQMAAMTQGYTPVMIEHLLDEALVNALRRGGGAMSMRDIERARLDGGDRPRPAGAVHRQREAPDRDARGRPRHGCLADRAGTPARGAHDHQAPRRAGAARPRRPRRGVHPLPHGDAQPHPDRDGRPGRRGAVLRRRLHRSGRRPAHRDHRRRADGRRLRHDRQPGLVPGGAGRGAVRHEHRRPGARRRPGPGRRRDACSPSSGTRSACCSARTGTWSPRCATRWSNGTS